MPFLVCDPQAGVKKYNIMGLPGITEVPSQMDGSLRVDVSNVPAGTYSIRVSACVNDLWCSLPSPFDFTRPDVALPTNLRLVAN